MRHRNEGGSTSAEGRERKREDPSLFIPEAGGVPVPFPGVKFGRTFFSVGSCETNCYWEKRGAGGGGCLGGSGNKVESPRLPLKEKPC